MKTRHHLLAVILLAFIVGMAFLREPGFGDDLTYWTFAFDLHERGFDAWQVKSFHDLRWPVWGVCWLLQPIFGYHLASFYGVPLLYLAAGASIAFVFGKRVLGSVPFAWACAIAFLFHPLLDSVAFRPMPDLSEGVWGGAVLLAWWGLMAAKTRALSIAWAALTGLLIFLLESNRITGVFIVPVLLVATLLLHRARFGWLVAAGLFAAFFYGLECAFYKWLFDDWLHNLHANMGAKGSKGTESIPFWYLPFRFLDTLWKGNPLAPFYCIPAALGIWTAWKRHGAAGKLMVVWFATLYLEYACAPQSLWPWRPLIRDADRFLCGLTIPMSVLAATGLATLVSLSRVQGWKAVRWMGARPLATTLGALVLMFAVTTRERYDMGFVPEMRRYMAALPTGTRVFTHEMMRAIAHLVDAKEARRMEWHAPNHILAHNPQIEALAAKCDEFWYVRKLVWLNTRKLLEKDVIDEKPKLASYFDAPEREWRMSALLAKGDTPDFIFHHRRKAGDPPPQILDATAPEFAGLIPPLPIEWDAKSGKKEITATWNIPENLRGRLARFEIDAASERVEAFTIVLSIQNGRRTIAECLLKPYLSPDGGKDFFAFALPPDADHCVIELKQAKSARDIRFNAFRAVIEQRPE
jgi:hypothetical protein